MTDNLAEQAGSAIIWKAVQLLGVKGLSITRLLVLAIILATLVPLLEITSAIQ